MEMYKTINEAVEIARNTYKGRTYTMGVYKERSGGDALIATVSGDAVYFYGEQLFHDIKRDGIYFWPIDNDDVEGMALMETIFTIHLNHAPRFSFQIAARDLLNAIVEEAEKA